MYPYHFSILSSSFHSYSGNQSEPSVRIRNARISSSITEERKWGLRVPQSKRTTGTGPYTIFQGRRVYYGYILEPSVVDLLDSRARMANCLEGGSVFRGSPGKRKYWLQYDQLGLEVDTVRTAANESTSASSSSFSSLFPCSRSGCLLRATV